jgi:acetyltransferase-like isoleucine patch superfamily enzyme
MGMSGREALKTCARAAAAVAVAPMLVSYHVRAKLLGRDRALEGSSQVLACAPGIPGQYLRRAFLSRVLAACHATVTIEFGTTFSKVGARLDENVYVGPGCHLGLVHIERDVLLAPSVHVPSGGHTHGTTDLAIAIREQPGERRVVRIGAGTWIGTAAVVLADVGRHTIVGAGAVVTRPLPDGVVAGGVPARVLRTRHQAVS